MTVLSRIRIPAGQPACRVLDFLCQRFPHIPAEQWQQRLTDQQVTDQQGQVLLADQPVRPGDIICYQRHVPDEPLPAVAPVLLHQDEHLLVVDKPHGMTTAPVGQYVQRSVLAWLVQHTGEQDLAPLHRLDRDTAGVLAFSRSREKRAAYHACFARHQALKIYEAIAPAIAHPAGTRQESINLPCCRLSRLAQGEPFFRMQEVNGTANAMTEISLLETDGQWSRYELKPLTGKQHQLRVHMAALGLPIRHDPWYPVLQPQPADQLAAGPPLQLLARSLSLPDPASGALQVFTTRQNLQLAITCS